MAASNSDVQDEKVPPTPAADAIPDPAALAELTELCRLARHLSTEKATLEAAHKEVTAEINRIAEELNLPRAVAWDEWTLRRAPGSRKEISAEKLMERGVPLAVIQDSTVVKTWEPYAVFGVKARKDKKGGDE